MGRDEDISLGAIKRYLNETEAEVEVDGPFKRVEPPFEIRPRELLEFAEYDFSHDYDHHLLNALSNAKRAITCQIDSLLCIMLLRNRSRKEDWNFPRKVDILNKLGIISPPILTKVNKRRNLLEHEYRRPSEEEVEDAIGIAQLFISSTDKFLINGLGKAAFYSESRDYQINLWLESEKSCITVEAEYEDGTYHKRFVSIDSDEYLEILAIMVGLNTEIYT